MFAFLIFQTNAARLKQFHSQINKQMTIDLNIARDRLNALKNETVELSKLSLQERQAVELDQQSVGRLSRMDAMQQQAMAQAQERKRATILIRIDQAFKLIEQGEYGYCLTCGEEIAEKRLEIDPTATHCVACISG